MRGLVTGGMVLKDLADEERATRGFDNNGMGLSVEFVGQYGKHAAAKNAGFQKNDLIVELGGNSTRLSESELFGQFLNKYSPGQKVNATVLRGKDRIPLSLPIQ